MKKQYRFALNLQQFAEVEDGFDDTSSFDTDSDTIEMDQADFASSEENEQPEVEDTTQTDDATEEVPAPQTLKLKYNGEEREISLEEAQALSQKGMNYERAIERAAAEAAQAARDSYIAEQGYEWQGRAITTEGEYKAALAEQELMQKYQNLPPELVNEIMAGRRDREQRAQEREAAEAKARQEQDLSSFLVAFQELHERPFDGNKDVVPAAVWEAHRNGAPLRYAYMEHHNKELRNQLKISRQNETNGKKAPIGSVTANGGSKKEAVDPFLEGFNSI